MSVSSRPNLRVALVCVSIAFLLIGSHESLADPPNIEGYRIAVEGSLIRFTPEDPKSVQDLVLPRLFNSVRSVTIVDGETRTSAKLLSEPTTWKVVVGSEKLDWSRASIELALDGPPQWNEVIVSPEADGSFRLRACHALTQGNKLLFEPQPHKNTIGYWIDSQALAWWTINVATPGRFHVGVLAGCGTGQGGSQVEIQAIPQDKASSDNLSSKPEITTEFVVEETGHFQNFRWRHVGEIEFTRPGQYRIRVRCIEKAKNAVVDIRELQLVRLPER